MPSKDVPKTHPRFQSLMTREQIVAGVEKGITSLHGLIAQGRGEAFDYLIGEKTTDFAMAAIEAGAAELVLAEHPVISVNGNVAALVPEEIVKLSEVSGAKIEVNIFHTSKEREEKMKVALGEAGAKEVLMPDPECVIGGVDHNRRFVNPEGIGKADLILVPLEDGDRCEMLVNAGKKVVTVDLNPKSRTSRTSTVTVVDNVIRVIPLLTEKVQEFQGRPKEELEEIVANFSNLDGLKAAEECIVKNFLGD